jgi:hypothetical protein
MFFILLHSATVTTGSSATAETLASRYASNSREAKNNRNVFWTPVTLETLVDEELNSNRKDTNIRDSSRSRESREEAPAERTHQQGCQ